MHYHRSSYIFSPITSVRYYFLRAIYHLWLLKNNFFFTTSSGKFLSLEGWDITFRAESSKVSHSLHNIYVCVSVIITIYLKKKLLLWGMRHVLAYGYKNMLLGVIVLLCFASRWIAGGFLLETMTYQVTGSWSFRSVRFGFHLMEWVLNKTKVWLL